MQRRVALFQLDAVRPAPLSRLQRARLQQMEARKQVFLARGPAGHAALGFHCLH